MKKILLVAGARPNFMKVAPILRELRRREPSCAELVHTGQHYDAAMSAVFFEELGIPAPDVSLEVGSGTHGAQTARILERFEAHLLENREQVLGVVVVGDVNSTVAATLAASKLGVPVAHVEAGLRSFDRSMPEEINRLVTDCVADLLLVSEPAGQENLAAEGVPEDKVVYVGNVMIDTLVTQLEAARALQVPASMGLEERGYAVLTVHRPSNVDVPERLEALCVLIEELSRSAPIVFPVHPRTRAALDRADLAERLSRCEGLILREPLGYRELLGLTSAARLVITDSGGIQEETSFLGVPCITLRPNTERPVTVRLGTNSVVNDLKRARAAVRSVLAAQAPAQPPDIPGWDGRAAERVVDALLERWARPGVSK